MESQTTVAEKHWKLVEQLVAAFEKCLAPRALAGRMRGLLPVLLYEHFVNKA
jgi:hypothetical protein